jgi:hypothetical protein
MVNRVELHRRIAWGQRKVRAIDGRWRSSRKASPRQAINPAALSSLPISR